jgi:polyphosphate glucokinase
MHILGIDIGGTGIKGAIVDIEKGELVTERHRILTPESGKPQPMAETVKAIVEHFDWRGPVGCGFPAAVRQGIVLTAANIHKSWIGTNAETLFGEMTGCPVKVINDADAAGLAEMTFGAGKGRMDVVLLITIGTGLGTVLFTEGKLLPNAELGHIEIDGKDAELNASDAARKRDKLTWKKWGKRFNTYLTRLEALLWPDLIILGGGTAKNFDDFAPYLSVQTPVVVAEFLNEAGIVGAALAGGLSVGPAAPDEK